MEMNRQVEWREDWNIEIEEVNRTSHPRRATLKRRSMWVILGTYVTSFSDNYVR